MSRTVERREVERLVNVYACDRCGSELPGSKHYGVTRPGEGTQITSRGDGEWEPLLIPTGDDQYSLSQASNIDLCATCLDGLRDWVRGSDSNTERGLDS